MTVCGVFQLAGVKVSVADGAKLASPVMLLASAMLTLAMDLAEALSLPMSVIWAAIHSWIDQGLV